MLEELFGRHAGYIIGSYFAAALVLGWMIGSAVLANRTAQARLKRAQNNTEAGASHEH